MKQILLLYALLSLFFTVHTQEKTIYILPFAGFEHNEALFNSTERDGCTQPYIALRNALNKRGYTVQSIVLDKPNLKDVYAILCFNLPRYQSAWDYLPQYAQKTLLFLWEPPTVNPYDYQPNNHTHFNKVFTMFDAMVDDKKYFKLFYPQPSLSLIDDTVPFGQKHFCTLIACNKTSKHPDQLYSKRTETIQFFERHAPHNLDFYGIGWPPGPCYRGTITTKSACLKQYKFCICYENMMNQNGYITEKIFDCMVAGCIPIYWGADNITDYIPAECFIDRRTFESDQKLYEFLQTIDEVRYQKYLQAIKLFFNSQKAQVFSIEYFVSTVLKALNIQ